MGSRYEWRDEGRAGLTRMVMRVEGIPFGGYEPGAYQYFGKNVIGSWIDNEQARRAVESAFEAWLDRAGLVWKDSPTEENEA